MPSYTASRVNVVAWGRESRSASSVVLWIFNDLALSVWIKELVVNFLCPTFKYFLVLLKRQPCMLRLVEPSFVWIWPPWVDEKLSVKLHFRKVTFPLTKCIAPPNSARLFLNVVSSTRTWPSWSGVWHSGAFGYRLPQDFHILIQETSLSELPSCKSKLVPLDAKKSLS